jgi:hypothetical protein
LISALVGGEWLASRPVYTTKNNKNYANNKNKTINFEQDTGYIITELNNAFERGF